MTRWLPIFTFIASCVVAYDYHINPTGWYDLALFFLPLTFIFTIMLMRRIPDDNGTDSPEPVAWQPFTCQQISLVVVGIVCLFFLTQTQGQYPRVIAALFWLHHNYQFLLWVLGLVFIIWGMSGGIPLRQSRQIIRGWLAETDIRLLLVFMTIGFVVRVVWLDSGVPNYIDEASFARGITSLRMFPLVRIMNNMDSIANFTWVYAYLQYIYTEVFGANLANLRAISVIVGTLTIPAVYLLGRWTFNRRIALLATFLLAIDLPHIHFSRLAMNNIADPLFGVLAIAFLWQGLQIRSRRYMAWAGFCLGMTSYFYEGGRLVFLGLVISWLILYALMNYRTVFKRGLVIFLITLALVASGFYLSLATLNSDGVTPRLASEGLVEMYWVEQSIAFDEDPLGTIMRFFDERINPPYLHIMSQPDGSHFYYSPRDGLVLPPLLPFFLIGIGIVLFYWRRFGLIFPMWLLLTVIGNSLIWSNNWTPRFAVVFPAIVLLIAVGLDGMYRAVIWQYSSLSSQYKLPRVAIVSLMLMGVLTIGYYFNVVLPEYNIWFRQKMDDQDATYRAQALPSDTDVYIIPTEDSFHAYLPIVQSFEKHTNIIQFLPVENFNFNVLNPEPDHPYAFFIERDDTVTRDNLKRIFGETLIGPEWSPYNVPEQYEFALYRVDPHHTGS